MSREKKIRRSHPVGIILITLLFIAAEAGLVMLHWFDTKWSTGFQEMLYTMTSPLKGTGSDILNLGLRDCLPPMLLMGAAYIIAMVLCCNNRLSRKITRNIPGRGRTIVRRVLCALAAVMLIVDAVYAETSLGVIAYFRAQGEQTTLYDEYYVDPQTAGLTQEGTQRNVLWIVMESMETTYASTEDGGVQSVNQIPALTALASDNLSFSDKTGLGGFRSAFGTGWTMAALFAQMSGIPYTYPIDQNLKNISGQYAPGLTTFGDILAEHGYRQVFLCGSDATFGGRRSFFEQHGGYEILDLPAAKEQGYIPEDYYKWWGFEDERLYDIAKRELTELAASGEPFNLTMLTVDTHHPYGYACDLCEDDPEDANEHTATVVRCADRQLQAFIEWVQAQDFYADTTVIITGDHPRMDTGLTEGVAWEDRTVYNVILNAAAENHGATTGRLWTTMDMLPTALAAMGFTWNGDRLGLGTSMLSGAQTLCEELGWENLNAELKKSSSYYLQHFANP